MLELVITDDGRGFDPTDRRHGPDSGHLGLALLHDRATRAGGELMLDSRPGGGTSVRLVLPLEESE
jgi:signal transduction histidine kinase